MTKPQHLLFLFMLALSLSSCGNDENVEIKNELIFNGETHPLKSGKLINFTNMGSISQYDIQLNSSELDEEGNVVDPIFNQFYFRIGGEGSQSNLSGPILASLMVINAEPGSHSNLEAYHVNYGGAEVKYSNGTYTIRFEGTVVNALNDDETEIEFSGSYQGPLFIPED